MYLTIHDETTTGSILNHLKVKVSTKAISAKELIRTRVFQEVEAFNNKRNECFRGLVQPSHAERVLNGFILNRKYKINAEQHFNVALEAFRKHAFFILVDETRVDDPDFVIPLHPSLRISFLKLTPVQES